jgi:hypothetical protein
VTVDVAASENDRSRQASALDLEFFCVARELAIRRAARDAHRTECRIDAWECGVCRMHAEQIADAKHALQREHVA